MFLNRQLFETKYQKHTIHAMTVGPKLQDLSNRKEKAQPWTTFRRFQFSICRTWQCFIVVFFFPFLISLFFFRTWQHWELRLLLNKTANVYCIFRINWNYNFILAKQPLLGFFTRCSFSLSIKLHLERADSSAKPSWYLSLNSWIYLVPLKNFQLWLAQWCNAVWCQHPGWVLVLLLIALRLIQLC